MIYRNKLTTFLTLVMMVLGLFLLPACGGSDDEDEEEETELKAIDAEANAACTLISKIDGNATVDGIPLASAKDKLNKITCLNARGTLLMDSRPSSGTINYKSLGYVIAELSGAKDGGGSPSASDDADTNPTESYVYILSSLYLTGSVSNPLLDEALADSADYTKDFYKSLSVAKKIDSNITLSMINKSTPILTQSAGESLIHLVGYGRVSATGLKSPMIDLVAVNEYLKEKEQEVKESERTHVESNNQVIAFGIYRVAKSRFNNFNKLDNDNSVTIVSLGKDEYTLSHVGAGHYMTLENAHELFANTTEKKAEAWVYKDGDIEFPDGAHTYVNVEIGDGFFNLADDFPPFTYNTLNGRMESLSFFAEDQPANFNNQFQIKSLVFLNLIKQDLNSRSQHIVGYQNSYFPFAIYQAKSTIISPELDSSKKSIYKHCGVKRQIATEEGSDPKTKYTTYKAYSFLESQSPIVKIKLEAITEPSNLLSVNGYEATSFIPPAGSSFDLIEVYINEVKPANRINRFFNAQKTSEGTILTLNRDDITKHYNGEHILINEMRLSELEMPPVVLVRTKGMAIIKRDQNHTYKDTNGDRLPDDLSNPGILEFCAVLTTEQNDHSSAYAETTTSQQITQQREQQGLEPLSDQDRQAAVQQALQAAGVGATGSQIPSETDQGNSGNDKAANGTTIPQSSVGSGDQTMQQACYGASCYQATTQKKKTPTKRRNSDGCSIDSNNSSKSGWILILMILVPLVAYYRRQRI